MARFVFGLLAALVAVVMLAGSPAHAQDWLDNGDFENGTAGWSVSEGYTPQCEAFEGNGALGVGATGIAFPVLGRNLIGPFPAATYTLSGWLRVQSGSAQATLYFSFQPGFDVETADLPSTSEYAPFSFTTTAGSQSPEIQIRFSLETTDGAEVCIDNLSLTTPDPLPTDTPEAPVPTETATPTATLESSSPTLTPTSPPTASVTPAPSATSTATPGPSFIFSNGGFEEGLRGWSKYGGDLTTTSGAFSGSSAGLLTSNTQSTKWAYQAVAVSDSRSYEFAAYVQPGDGAQQALLRISWYQSDDAGGSATGTVDSLESAAGSAGFVFLTTGAVSPPAGARSARVRVLLVPAGATYSTLAIDDVSFRAVAAPTPTNTATPSATPEPPATLPPTPPPVPSPTPVEVAAAVVETPRPAQAGAIAAEDTPQPRSTDVAATPVVPLAQAASQRIALTQPPSISETLASNRKATSGDRAAAVPWAWVLGGLLLVFGLGGAYLQGRKQG